MAKISPGLALFKKMKLHQALSYITLWITNKSTHSMWQHFCAIKEINSIANWRVFFQNSLNPLFGQIELSTLLIMSINMPLVQNSLTHPLTPPITHPRPNTPSDLKKPHTHRPTPHTTITTTTLPSHTHTPPHTHTHPPTPPRTHNWYLENKRFFQKHSQSHSLFPCTCIWIRTNLNFVSFGKLAGLLSYPFFLIIRL